MLKDNDIHLHILQWSHQYDSDSLNQLLLLPHLNFLNISSTVCTFLDFFRMEEEMQTFKHSFKNEDICSILLFSTASLVFKFLSKFHGTQMQDCIQKSLLGQ